MLSAGILGASSGPDTLEAVCVDNGLGVQDETEDAGDDDPLDVSLSNDGTLLASRAVYLGDDQPFAGIRIDVGLPGTGGSIRWEYWNGAAWRSLLVSDDTQGFHNLGPNNVTWSPPDDWLPVALANCPAAPYWVKVRTTNAYTLQAIANEIDLLS